jgi:hypothetical protein
MPLVRWPILLIQSPLHRVKSSADRSSPSNHHRHWPPTQLHSHHRRHPRRHRVMLGCLSRIGRPRLRQIHAATLLIRLPPPHWSGHSYADPPPPEMQSAASTTATLLLFERMRDQRLWAYAWLSTWSFQSAVVVFLFYLIIDRDCIALPFIDVWTLTPPKDEVAVVHPLDHNSDACGQVLFDDAATPIRPPLPLPSRHPTQVAPPPSTTSTTTTTSTSATSSSKGYHLHVVLTGFCSSHNIRTITTL